MFDGRPERGLLMTGPLVVQTIEGRKTETRRVGDRYRKWKRGDIVYVRETWAHGTQPNQVFYRANRKPGHANTLRWRPSIHMPKWAARVWLELTADVTYEPLQSMIREDILAEGVRVPAREDGTPLLRLTGKHPPTDYLPAGCLTDGTVNGDMLLRAEFASLWDTINSKRGPEDDPCRFTWERNPEVAVIRYRVLSTAGRPTP